MDVNYTTIVRYTMGPAISRGAWTARATLPRSLIAAAVRKLDWILAATVLVELRLPPGNRLGHYRICFAWANGEAIDIQIDVDH